jgi:hypothetical protein
MRDEALNKLQLAEKYGWTERHSLGCQCLYCVMMEKLSRDRESEAQRRRIRDAAR